MSQSQQSPLKDWNKSTRVSLSYIHIQNQNAKIQIKVHVIYILKNQNSPSLERSEDSMLILVVVLSVTLFKVRSFAEKKKNQLKTPYEEIRYVHCTL